MLNTLPYSLEALDRAIDPWSKETIAAWGWFKQARNSPEQYWVSIEDEPYQVFSKKTTAREFYYFHTRNIRSRFNQRKKRGPQQRSKRPALAVLTSR